MAKIFQKYQQLIGADKDFMVSNDNVQVTGEEASALIAQRLLADKPVMIGRFGSTELSTLLNYYFIKGSLFSNISNLVKGIPYFFHFKNGLVHDMNVISGFFPADVKNLERFCEMYLEDIPEIDILGSWLSYEKHLFKYMNKDHVRIQLEDLSPFNHAHPWSKALEGKKVLVVHPFEESIINQYKKRELLFQNPDVLPAFDLKIVRAVQSNGNSETVYKDWFEALDYMTEQIAKSDFDIAILGCGAYGMPLAARIKRMGKKAIHVGGAVQCMFGIKGKRWEIPFYNFQQKFYNEHWVRPLETEKPKDALKVEAAAYW
ncbi:MAG: hypothetical protein ABIQ88_07050 [Chitinophagaceae bacterium]